MPAVGRLWPSGDDDGDDDGHGMDDGRSASHDVNIRDGAAGENEKKEAEEASDQPHPLIFCTSPLSYICQPVNHSPSMVFLQDLALSPLFRALTLSHLSCFSFTLLQSSLLFVRS